MEKNKKMVSSHKFVQVSHDRTMELPVPEDAQELLEIVVDRIEAERKRILGEVLTIVDASVEKERAKFVKDLVHNAVSYGVNNENIDEVRGYIRAYTE